MKGIKRLVADVPDAERVAASPTKNLKTGRWRMAADFPSASAKSRAAVEAAGQKVQQTKAIMEINPTHPMVQQLKTAEARFDDWSLLLFDQALLAEGGQLDDPAGFVKRLNELMLELAGAEKGETK